MNIIDRVVEAANLFEQINSKNKKDYLSENIKIFNKIAKTIPGYMGFFGLGYPFYALNNSDNMPIIEEQIRYNNELLKYNCRDWYCEYCLQNNCNKMPNLKIICKRCKNMDDNLKPRKILTRVTDMDYWFIVKDEYKENAKIELINSLKNNNIHTSDINPIKTINDYCEIVNDIKNNIKPKKYLPVDIHIITYSTLCKCIINVKTTIDQFVSNNKIPYMPICTEALRKKWQFDEEACDFVHDYIYSFTEFDFDDNLTELLNKSRKELINSYSVEELYDIALNSGKSYVRRREENIILKNNFIERINKWKII